MPRNSSSATVMKFKIKKQGSRLDFLKVNRIPNINHKLEIEAFTLSRTKVYEIIFLMNKFGTSDHMVS